MASEGAAAVGPDPGPRGPEPVARLEPSGVARPPAAAAPHRYEHHGAGDIPPAGRCLLRHSPYAKRVRRSTGGGEDVMPESSGLMRGKRGLIMGVANNRSIAWGIAKACHAQGAELAFTYQGDALKKRVEPLAQEVGGLVVGHCDVTEAATMDAVFADVGERWGALDFLVHAIAFSDKDELTGRYVDTTPDNFAKTLQVSCYSFTALAQRAEKLMPNGGSLLTLSYYGAEKWMPHYNVMGVAKAALEASVRYLAADLGAKNIRVNAISAGPIKTLAASGIGDFRYILKWNEYNSPMRRTVTIEEVGDTAVYFLSDLARGVTGEIVHVDAGYHIVGMKHPEAPDIAVAKE
jgi:enoyl-[acyl-carrier protein] reductase I